MSSRPLTVVVVTYNSAGVLPSFLASLDAGLEGIGDWSLVVADNASTDDGTRLVREARPEATIADMGGNRGYAAAINAAIAAGDPVSDVLVLNPDVRLGPGSIRRLADALTPQVGIAVPTLVDARGARHTSLRRDPGVRRVWAESLLGGRLAGRLGWGELVTSPAAYAGGTDVDWASGAVLLISRAALTAAGAWDESWFLYSEEVDYCQRVRAAGFRVRHVPAAVVEHDEGPYGANPDLWRLLIANRVELQARRRTWPAVAAFRAGLAAGAALRAPVSGAARTALRQLVTDAPVLGRGPGFVWFAGQDWWYHNQSHSDFQLMRQVAAGRPVLVVNSLGLRRPTRANSSEPWQRIGRKLRSMARFVAQPLPETPQFHVMTPIMLPAYGSGAVARANQWLIRQQVTWVGRAIGLGRAPHVGVTLPTAWPVASAMGRSSLIFNRSDLQSTFPGADRDLLEGYERALMEHSDVVLYVSHELMRDDAALVGERAFFIDHGVDVDRFTGPFPEPAELAGIPHPRMGFFGALDDHLVDMELLTCTARDLPDHQLILIGSATCPMEELTALPNVHWLGQRPYADIPALGSAFDVGLMPWMDNEWIRYANPIKLKEYLALGLPIVSTAYPEVDDYRDRVLVADDRDRFSDLVREAPGRDSPEAAEARRRSVQGLTWTAKAAALTRRADEVLARHGFGRRG